MSKHWKYLVYLLRHKWWVILYGRKLCVPFGRLLAHDLSKFLPDEWFPYANYFYGSGDSRFQQAWKKHLVRNNHHWDFWANQQYGLPMPDVVIREMIADWMSVGKIKGNNAKDWYEQRKDKMTLDPNTRHSVEVYLRYVQ